MRISFGTSRKYQTNQREIMFSFKRFITIGILPHPVGNEIFSVNNVDELKAFFFSQKILYEAPYFCIVGGFPPSSFPIW